MSKEVVQNGNDFEIIQDDRAYGGVRTSVFKVDGNTGKATVNGSTIVTANSTLSFTVNGRLGVGAVTLAGVTKGDIVEQVINLTAPSLTTLGTDYEKVISKTGQIQQLTATDRSAQILAITIFKQ